MNFIQMGEYFGYPKCCIAEFIEFVLSRGTIKREKRKLNGSGYVPCAKCNKLTKQQLIRNIQTNRKHNEPFPIARSFNPKKAA